MPTQTNFQIQPVDGDWIYLEHDSNKPRKIDGKGQLNLMHLFSPIRLTPDVMGWIGEAEFSTLFQYHIIPITDTLAIRVNAFYSNLINNVDPEISLVVVYSETALDEDLSITHLHELQG